MQKIINFVKYNNSFIIILGIIFLGAGSSFASETVRDAVIGQTIEEVNGMDNSALLSADLNSLKQEMGIADVSEDEENYYVGYSFSTFDIKDNIWQNQTKTQTLKVPKEALNGGKDLGLYVQSELAQVMDAQLAYLKDAQEREQKKGQTKIIKTTKYTGLKGLVLNSETKELEGYTPVMKKEERVAIRLRSHPSHPRLNHHPRLHQVLKPPRLLQARNQRVPATCLPARQVHQARQVQKIPFQARVHQVRQVRRPTCPPLRRNRRVRHHPRSLHPANQVPFQAEYRQFLVKVLVH
ncbi:MAG: hypothetical protein UW04_C0058G0002 [Parcubacteria group bacterium GW2011_GWB1_43_8]|nr:MAG: hypothetical protein UW04_C0058G0002 [Parcubacteria group bacterium GW2011_GWB1_43_8]